VFDGAVWRCKADVCRSTKVKSLPPLRSCKRLARELGTDHRLRLSRRDPVGRQLASATRSQIAKTPARSEVAAAR
jgi:hypothetical protein